MTTDNTQAELTDDQYLRFEVLVPMYSALEKQRRENIKLGYMQDASGIYGEAIRQFLDWHNKQVEEVLDRLTVADNISDRACSEAIAAERAKLKEVK